MMTPWVKSELGGGEKCEGWRLQLWRSRRLEERGRYMNLMAQALNGSEFKSFPGWLGGGLLSLGAIERREERCGRYLLVVARRGDTKEVLIITATGRVLESSVLKGTHHMLFSWRTITYMEMIRHL